MKPYLKCAQRLLTLSLILFLLASPSLAIAVSLPPALDGSFRISPDRIQAGKTRDVTITADTGDLKGVEPQPPPSGSGITFEAVAGQTIQRPNDKTIMVRIKVDEEADRGTVPINLTKDGKSVGVVNLEITEFRPSKISRGPTPDDIDFEVDAMWSVVPYKIAKANFGNKAADAFYAIEVFLGNNTGFDIQVVGVGFETSQERRTIDSEGKPLNFLMNDKGAVTDAYGNKFIEAVDKDGHRLLTADGKPTFRIFRKYHLPSSDHRLVRGTIELDQLYGKRALALNLIAGVGTLLSGFIPFFHAANAKANFSTFTSIINGQLKEGFAIAAPDLTVSQLNRLENVALHEGLTVMNNSQAKTMVFFPRYLVGLSKKDMKEMDREGEMWRVLDRLGELIIVGKPIIAYRNREIVATRPQPPPAPPAPNPVGPPTVTGVAPNAGNKVTITGTNFVPGSQVSFGGVPAPNVSFITTTQLDVEIPEGALSGRIKVTTPSGSNESPSDVIFPPIIKNITPKTVVPGTAMTIEGENLGTVKEVKFGSVSQKVFRSQVHNKIVLDVPDKAESGITLVTEKAGEASNSDVIAQPILDPLTTKTGKTGDRITISGKNLANAQVSFGDVPGEVVNSSATSVEVKVPKNAVSGPITVRTAPGLEKKTSEDFTFIPAPLIVNFSVNGSAPLSEVAVKAGDEVVIGGQNLKGTTQIIFGGTEVKPVSSDDNKITVKVPDVLPAAPEGMTPGKITIRTPGGEVSPEKFTFIPTPTITTFSINGESKTEGKAGQTLVIGGENLAGLSAVKFNDITANFTNANDKQFTVVIPANVPAGKVKIEITTRGGKATSDKFTIVQ